MKVLGYLIGGLFILGMLAPIGVAAWMIYDRVAVLTSTVSEPAVIESCYYKRTGSKNQHGSWGPVAITKTGTEVKGDFSWSKKHWCESDIGDEVTVFMHVTDTSKNRINTFFQFWFLPLVFTVFSLTFYPLSYRAKKRQQSKNKD